MENIATKAVFFNKFCIFVQFLLEGESAVFNNHIGGDSATIKPMCHQGH